MGTAGDRAEVLWASSRSVPERRAIDTHRVLTAVVVAALVLVAVVSGVGLEVAHRLAETEAVDDAARTTDVLADAVIEPVLRDGLRRGDPRATAPLDAAVHAHVLGAETVRVKIWVADGTILYSDEPRLVGRRFTLGDEERAVLARPSTEAEVSDAGAPENAYERGQGKLLEVYRPVRTPSGVPLLFERYSRYDAVDAAATTIWQRFALLTLGSIGLVLVVLLLMLRGLLRLLDRAHEHRAALLQRAVDASAAERRRIAASLHDGVVQDLVATSFRLTADADRAPAAAREPLTGAARTVRETIGGLRSLLVDIYPPTLRDAGLGPALEDLGLELAARGIACDVEVDLDGGRPLPEPVEGLVFRVAHETLTNIAKHADAHRAAVSVRGTPGRVELSVADDGVGFDPVARRDDLDDHFGLRLLADAVRDSGLDAELRVGSEPGRGAVWRLVVRP